jgi:hypothetical protein
MAVGRMRTAGRGVTLILRSSVNGSMGPSLERTLNHPNLATMTTSARIRSRHKQAPIHELYKSMDGADYVVIDGILFETDYLRVPDEFTVADDVLLEARHGDTEIDMTHADFEGAIGVGEGVFRLRSGSLVRFLSAAVIH